MNNIKNKHFTKEFLISQWNYYFEILKGCPRTHEYILDSCKKSFEQAVANDDYEGMREQYQRVKLRVKYHTNK